MTRFPHLDEGLQEGLVTITELENERVDALWIENQSDRPLPAGRAARLIGGKQTGRSFRAW
jgi:hypothetical protein